MITKIIRNGIKRERSRLPGKTLPHAPARRNRTPGSPRILMGLLLIGLGGISAAGAGAAPVGMVREKTGNPQVRIAFAASFTPLRVMQALNPGDVVRCPPGSQAEIILFNDGHLIKLGPGQAVVGKTGITGASVTAAGAVSEASTHALQVIGGRIGGYRTDTSRGGSLLPQRLMPSSPGWILRENLTDGVLFQWISPGQEARSWMFTLFDPDGNIVWSFRTNAVKRSPEGQDLVEAFYRPNLRPLSAGRPYVWRVTSFGITGLPLADYSWGIITILTPEQADALAKDTDSLLPARMDRLMTHVNALRDAVRDQVGADAPATLKLVLTDATGVQTQIQADGQAAAGLADAASAVVTAANDVQAGLDQSAAPDALRQKVDKLQAVTTGLDTRLKQDAGYVTSLLLLARVYQGYGVIQRTVETLGDLPDQAAAHDALAVAYQDIAPYGRLLAGQEIPGR